MNEQELMKFGSLQWEKLTNTINQQWEERLDKIVAEIPKLVCCENEYRQALVKVADVIKCIDKYRKEQTT